MHIRKNYLKGARLLFPPHSQLVWKSSLCLLKILNGSLQSVFSAPITQHLPYLPQVMMQQTWLQLWTHVHTLGGGGGSQGGCRF